MFEKVVCRLTKTPGSLEDVLLRELPYTEDKEVKSSEDSRSRVIGETTLRMASAELPRQGCHFMNAFVLIARFTKTTGSLGGTSKIRILENGVVFITYVCVYIFLYI